MSRRSRGGRTNHPGRRERPWNDSSRDWRGRKEGRKEAIPTEGEGFEPPEPFGSAVFKTAAIDHSATPPGFSDGDTGLIRALLAHLVDDVFGHVDRNVNSYGDGDGVAGAGVDLDDLALVTDAELGVIGMVT